MENIIEFKNVSKSFYGVKVLKDINFSIKKGEVHALLGENGAGKSTLLNILHGIYTDYDGTVILNDKKINFKNANDAIINGKISKVHQETNIVKELTVGENITLGHEPRYCKMFLDRKNMHILSNKILKSLQCRFKSEDMTDDLSAGDLQMIAIAKALFHNSKVVSLDEPTASLTNKETDALFETILKLKRNLITVIYVSHRLEEIFKIADRATILRDGAYINTLEVANTSREEIISNMVGRNVNLTDVRDTNNYIVKEETYLKVNNLTKSPAFYNINFDLKKGEILGFFGLIGSGRTDIMRTIFGADKKTSGDIFVKGKIANIKNTKDALNLGIGLIPEDRKNQGFIKYETNNDNIALTCLNKFTDFIFVNESKKMKNSLKYVKELNIHPSDIYYLTQNLSGGNQQKVILAKWMSTDSDILIFDEPTKGVDIAVKADIYSLMNEFVKNGKSIIIVSSELPEIMAVSDRIIVMYEGRQTANILRKDFNEQYILNYAMGGNNKK